MIPSHIAIDGPVAVGKSTVGKLVARKLGYLFVDTGEMYRAIAWLAVKSNIDPYNEKIVSELLSSVRIEVVGGKSGEESRTIVNGLDVTDELRTPEVEAAVSPVSRFMEVRNFLVNKQQEIALKNKVVMIGRDIGTVVLPRAGLKIYLTATTEERTRRRFLERGCGNDEAYRKMLDSLRFRDEMDSNRSIAPLRKAEDALVIDTNSISAEGVAEEILKLVKDC